MNIVNWKCEPRFALYSSCIRSFIRNFLKNFKVKQKREKTCFSSSNSSLIQVVRLSNELVYISKLLLLLLFISDSLGRANISQISSNVNCKQWSWCCLDVLTVIWNWYEKRLPDEDTFPLSRTFTITIINERLLLMTRYLHRSTTTSSSRSFVNV